MTKRGVTHVDWVISMTLFILGVLTVLIFILPLFNKPLYSKETLIPIVEENFQDSYWVVKKIPLFIIEYCSAQGFRATVTFGNGWVRDNNQGDQLIVTDPNPNTHWIFLHRETDDLPDELVTELDVNPAGCGENDKIYVGAEQNLIGLSNDFLVSLKNTPYGEVKDEWNYPLANDFAIYIYNLDGDLIHKIGAEEPTNLNVFVNQFRDFMLSEDGNLEEITVSLRAW